MTDIEKFEKAVLNAYEKMCAGKAHLTPYTNHVKDAASELLALAREGYVRREEKWDEVETTARNQYLRGYGDGKAEALKDLPRWKKCDDGNTGRLELEALRRIPGSPIEIAFRANGYRIFLSDLKKLPKEE